MVHVNTKLASGVNVVLSERTSLGAHCPLGGTKGCQTGETERLAVLEVACNGPAINSLHGHLKSDTEEDSPKALDQA